MLAPGSLAGLCACAPASEDASLRLAVDEAGAFVGVYAGSSAAGIEVDLDWSLVVTNHGVAACPVAAYRWDDALPDPATLPIAGEGPAAAAWPEVWAEGELLASAVVEPGGTTRFDHGEPEADEVGLLLGLAACPGAQLELEARADASADLGIRAISEALTVELWAIEPE